MRGVRRLRLALVLRLVRRLWLVRPALVVTVGLVLMELVVMVWLALEVRGLALAVLAVLRRSRT